MIDSSGAPVIQTQSLSKTFGQVTALRGVDCTVPTGVTGLVGANGAGKTTLMRILLGLTKADQGQASILGVPVSEHDLELRSRIGYMPEGDCLPLNQTAADFVVFAAELAGLPTTESRYRASEVLSLVGLHEERFRYIGDFSTGMKQRVKLAQSVVHDPDLILLDEPASGLDPEGREEMLQLIQRLGGYGTSILLSSHVLSDIEQTCQWVVMLDAGQVVRSAPIEAPTAGDTITIEVFGETETLAAALTSRGLQVQGQGSVLTATGGGQDFFEHIRDAIVATGCSVRRMGSQPAGLEDLFITAAHHD